MVPRFFPLMCPCHSSKSGQIKQQERGASVFVGAGVQITGGQGGGYLQAHLLTNLPARPVGTIIPSSLA